MIGGFDRTGNLIEFLGNFIEFLQNLSSKKPNIFFSFEVFLGLNLNFSSLNSIPVYREMQMNGLWRYDLTRGDDEGDDDDDGGGAAARLARMFGPNGGRREFGLLVSFEEEVKSRTEYVHKLSYSVDGGIR